SAGGIAPGAAGGFDVTGSHVYAASGYFPVNVTITDSTGQKLQLTGGQWSAGAPMPVSAEAFQAVSDKNGHVGAFISNFSYYDFYESYDRINGWTGTSLPGTRSHFAVATSADGRIFTFGGTDDQYHALT